MTEFSTTPETLVLPTRLDDLVLREFTTLADDREIHALVHRPGNREHCRELIRDYNTLDDITAERVLARGTNEGTSARENRELRLGMRLREALIGGLILTPYEAGNPDGNWIAFGTDKRYTRQGHTFAAVRAVIDYVSDSDLNNTLTTMASPDNTPSTNLLKKLGFKEGHREFNGYGDHIIFRLHLDSPAREKSATNHEADIGEGELYALYGGLRYIEDDQGRVRVKMSK